MLKHNSHQIHKVIKIIMIQNSKTLIFHKWALIKDLRILVTQANFNTNKMRKEMQSSVTLIKEIRILMSIREILIKKDKNQDMDRAEEVVLKRKYTIKILINKTYLDIRPSNIEVECKVTTEIKIHKHLITKVIKVKKWLCNPIITEKKEKKKMKS